MCLPIAWRWEIRCGSCHGAEVYLPPVPSRTALILIGVLLANVAAVLFFRHFTTVDGPMHVLNAAVLESHWTTPRFVADGLTYNTDILDVHWGDLLLVGLLRFLSPENAHAAFALLVCAALVLSVAACVRAYATRINATVLWLAPLSFNFLLVMGFFHFLLGIAICFGVLAWWKWKERSPLSRWSGVLGGMLLAWLTHRSGPILLGSMMAFLLVVELLQAKAGANKQQAVRTRWMRPVVAIGLVVMTIVGLRQILGDTVVRGMPQWNGHGEFFLLRPLLLVDRTREIWMLIALGTLLILSVAVGLVVRFRLGRKQLPHDALFLLACCFALTPFFLDTPKMNILYVQERCQLLALLALVPWLSAMANASSNWRGQALGFLALLVLPVQAARMVHLECTLAELQRPQEQVLEVCHRLAPGSLVVMKMAEPNWLLQHLSAAVAIRHNGIVLTEQDHLRPAPPNINGTEIPLLRLTRIPTLLPEHWAHGGTPAVDHILFLGNETVERGRWTEPWSNMLEEHYWKTFDNGYVLLFTAKPDTLVPTR